MRYNLDYKYNIESSLLFWINQFIRSKVNSLSNRQVKDQKKLANSIAVLRENCEDITHLKQIVKDVRNNGLIGINTYFLPLEKLYYHIKENFNFISLKYIDEELLSEFLASSTAGLSDATKKNYRIAIVGFFGFLDKQNKDEYDKSHIFNIELKNWGGISGTSANKLPSYLNEQEIKTFLKAIETYPFKKQFQARNKLVIKIILYTGIRVTEAININIKDITPQDNFYTIKIVGKGNKHRVVMIKSNIIEKDLQQWLDIRYCQNDALFCTKSNKRLSQAYISRTVELILQSCGIKKDKNGAHMLRHSYATILYKKRQDLVLVQEALGHASINTSKIYTHFDNEKLKSAADVMDEL